ncbi:MAG: family 20 glycosylhydrolase [Ignavibacteriales bacterium]|nr:family 20 glycosylhydrolase [Ignavibacteriales bacterium]MCB9218183.1 family 20 glycosylhydrolase [Ignavibacteriales bacterium]
MTLYSCNSNSSKQISIIPKPDSLVVNGGEFTINNETAIVYDEQFKNYENLADYLNQRLSVTNVKLNVKSELPSSNYMHFAFNGEIKNEEGYTFKSTTDGITISASNARGIFYGIQTLLQLLPAEIYSKEKSDLDLTIQNVSIIDEPRFKYRGAHLDVGRHFYSTDDVKKYIDYIAMHKMNKFHWHLTEDQGWRIEIKKYPKLTEIGAWRKETMGDGKKHGGFYTQEEVKEIVKYAEDRFITVIPEIEMPGHSLGALAAYPELSCTGGPFEVETIFGVHKDVYCAGNEKTFELLENVLLEVIDLFPSKYIHIGGDECPKDRWEKCSKCQARIHKEGLKNEHELQSYFIKRIEDFLLTKDRLIIGWDEILEGGLAPNATVMSWRGIEGGIEAAKQGNDVIMTPTSHCYFDYYQGNPENEPVAIGGYLPLSKVYSYEPIPEELSEDEAKHVKGTQANVWSEYLPEFKDVEYMLLPRLAALSEVCWSPKEKRNLDDFLKRLSEQINRYEVAGINYAKSSYNVSIGTKLSENKNSFDIELSTELSGAEIYYTLDGTEPNNNSEKYSKPFNINSTKEIKAVSYSNGKLMSKVSTKKILIHKAFGKKISIKTPYSERYDAGGEFGLVDGIYGSSSFTAGGWQGYEGNDFEAIVDLGEKVNINKVNSSYLQRINSWIFMPEYVEYSFSDDGEIFSDPTKIDNTIPNTSGAVEVKNFEINVNDMTTRYIKVFAKNIEKCPEWHTGAGGKAWIFVDEITVE